MDDIRKTLDNIFDLPHLLVSKASEHGIKIKNLSITVAFKENMNTPHTPVIKEAPKSGWRGNISAQVTRITPQAQDKDISPGAALFWDEWTPNGLFRGFHTCTGNQGTLGGSVMNIEFLFFLADFPKLAQQYPMYIKAADIEQKNYALWHAHEEAKRLYARSRLDIADIEIEIAELKKRKLALIQAHAKAYDTQHEFKEFEMPDDMHIAQYNFPKHIIIL